MLNEEEIEDSNVIYENLRNKVLENNKVSIY